MTLVTIRRALTTAALLALTLMVLTGPATAEDDPAPDPAQAPAEEAEQDPEKAHAQQVLEAIAKSDAKAAAAALGTGAAVDALVARPELVHLLLDRAHRTDGRLKAADAAARGTLVERLGALAAKTYAAVPDDDGATWAMALSLVLSERVAPSADAAAWDRAATMLEELHGRTPGSGEPLSYAVTILLEGAHRVPDASRALLTRAKATTKSAVKAHPRSDALAQGLGGSYVWASRTLFAKQRSASKQALRTALDTLKPLVERTPPNVATATVYNSAVTHGREAGFAFKNKYVTERTSALEGGVEFDIPVSARWSVRNVADTEEIPGYTYVTQKDAAGSRVRQMLFRRYYFGSDYDFEEGTTTTGDNLKGLVRAMQEMAAARTFEGGAKISKPSKGRLNKALSGLTFEVTGSTRDEKPAPLRLFGYAVKGSNQATIVVLVYAYGEVDDVGAEVEAVLESMREPDEG